MNEVYKQFFLMNSLNIRTNVKLTSPNHLIFLLLLIALEYPNDIYNIHFIFLNNYLNFLCLYHWLLGKLLSDYLSISFHVFSESLNQHGQSVDKIEENYVIFPYDSNMI